MIKIKLSEIAFIKMGQSPQGQTCNDVGVGLPLLNGPTEFTGSHPIPKQYTTDAKKISEAGDLLFCVRGSTTGRMNWSNSTYAIGRGLAALSHRKGKELNHFLKYLIQINLDSILRNTNGSTFPNLTSDMLASYEFIVPEIPIQNKISQFLSALDAKIELNSRINAELEAMAKTLYDYWFVQFDFPFDFAQGKPDKNGKPYKSSGGKMVWSEELKREIPEGWEVGELGDILSLEYGKPLKEGARSGNDYPVLGSNGIVGYHNEYLVEGPGIVVGRKGTAGAVVWVEDNFYPIDTTFYVKDKLNVGNLFLHYFLLLRSNFKDVESGSAVPGLNRNFVYSVKVAIPERNIIQDFNKIIEPFFSKVKVCNRENQTLTALRDWLLPMLMNGQVRVEAIEEKVLAMAAEPAVEYGKEN